MITRISLVFCCLLLFGECQNGRVLLKDVTSITLRQGAYTTGRRNAPVPQLRCVGGSARGVYAPKTVQCYNRGFDGLDVQWECKADMPTEFQFGKISVSCEGYANPNDPYILAGSCGLEYDIDYSRGGAEKASRGELKHSNPNESWIVPLIYFFIGCFICYLIYLTCSGPGYGPGEGGSGRYPYDGPGGPHPPGWRPYPSAPPTPPYDDGKTHSNAGFGSSAGINTPGGAGFWTGLGLGGLGGYFASQQFGSARRRRGPTQFERDTGFYDSHSEPGPSTSHSSSWSSDETHTSSGFGGTTRR